MNRLLLAVAGAVLLCIGQWCFVVSQSRKDSDS